MTTRTNICFIFLMAVALFFAASACSDPERLEVYDEHLQISEPIPLEHHVAMLNSTTEELILLALDGAEMTVRATPTGRDPLGLSVTPDRQRVAVLSRRDRSATVIDAATGEGRTYTLGSQFDTLAFSQDSRFAIAYFGANAANPLDELFNPNAYAIIDLEASPDAEGAVLQRSLRSFGSSPTEIHFVPPFDLDGSGTQVRYAMFLFGSYVTFADLTDADYEITVALTLSDTDPAVYPNRVLFTNPDDSSLQEMFVYMLASGSDDVYAINLLPGVDEQGITRLQPSINQLPSGDAPTDMATFIGPDGREKLLSVNPGSNDVALIDAATASVLRVPLEASANRIYQSINEQTGLEEPFALVYAEGGGSLLSFIKLHQLEERRKQAITTLALEGGVGELFNSPLPNQAIVVHQGGTGLSIVDLEGEFANPLRAQLTMSDVELDSAGRRLFASLEGSTKLNTVVLENSQASSLTLDFEIQRLLWLPKAGSLLAFHSSDTGLLTAVEVDVPSDDASAAAPLTRDAGKIYAGFLLEGLFNR